ncbi:hypothetical protein CYPRO_1304 [Cyclonatronum proteinivorum]|uniref:Uncharacterized protein n=1 Tax=Cyclonatronum proteinivorum TaxID=1457365 RepID=A0A345UJA9_9BACT|nr:hypothetical protein [Cyclonatronum proteinivorum]AXJ00561.1 hypothetical protein CYPRO_1304 [Cyclonatronum proteinivorum]
MGIGDLKAQKIVIDANYAKKRFVLQISIETSNAPCYSIAEFM